VARSVREHYRRATSPFTLEGDEQFVEVLDEYTQWVRRCCLATGEAIEEVAWPVTGTGCYIEEIAASPSGMWLVTQRISGQGDWGYDVFRSRPLAREAGIAEERGYILDLPRFAADESFLLGGAGLRYMGGWWAHPDDEIDEPTRGGPVSLGFLFIHRLPNHDVTRHELLVDLPTGWLPDDPWAVWYGPRDITPTADGVRLMPSWGVPVEIQFPIPTVIHLPVPHPSGIGVL
jgi:hypothetical protein